ncbi:C39 family peptidase, partial [Patescibacteria group bacterium]|nr:C39 family peptidase [Patescibacteria group bacterium]
MKINKLIIFSFLVIFFYLFAPNKYVFAGVTPDWNISFSWDGTTVNNGGQYVFPLNTAGGGSYQWPGGNAYGEIYRGAPHNSVNIAGHYLGYGGSISGQNDFWPAYGHYFVVIHEVGPNTDISQIVNWFETGTGNSPEHWGIIEFDVVESIGVPLYTQVISDYPSEEETLKWTNEKYVDGQSECGYYIRQCGCAITSIVMVARYYDITEAQGQDVNPFEINNWLKNEPGGYINGNVNWIAGARYADWRIAYAKTDKNTDNYTLLDQYLNQNNPVIAKANAGRGGINRQHFFVIDNKLASTYGVKDPAWYNTKTLDETTDINNHIRGYENGFDGLRIYKKGNGIAQSAMTIVLGSPAELLITDPLGRKLGKDVNGIEYSEIPNAWYFEDGFDDPTGENPPAQERNKFIQILEPQDGEYKLEVIGTGEGDYSLDANFYDTQGNVNNKSFQSEIAVGYTANYNLSFNSSNSASNIVELIDEIPPEAKIYFNPSTQKLEVKG